MKRQKLLLATLALLIGAASAAGSKSPPGSNDMIFHKLSSRAAP